MPARTMCFSMAAALAAVVALTACGNGGSGGNTGGSGGQGGATTSSTTGSPPDSSSTSTGSGGAPGCIELCTRLNMCPGTMMSDCATACPGVDSANTDGKCTDAYTAFVACELADSDPCTAADNACLPQADDYVSCYGDFCGANPQHAGCM